MKNCSLEEAIKKVWGFKATLFVDIELRKCEIVQANLFGRK